MSRPCGVCAWGNEKDQMKIFVDLLKGTFLGGASYSSIAARTGTSKSAVARHYDKCLIDRLVKEHHQEQFRIISKDLARCLREVEQSVPVGTATGQKGDSGL